MIKILPHQMELLIFDDNVAVGNILSPEYLQDLVSALTERILVMNK